MQTVKDVAETFKFNTIDVDFKAAPCIVEYVKERTYKRVFCQACSTARPVEATCPDCGAKLLDPESDALPLPVFLQKAGNKRGAMAAVYDEQAGKVFVGWSLYNDKMEEFSFQNSEAMKIALQRACSAAKGKTFKTLPQTVHTQMEFFKHKVARQFEVDDDKVVSISEYEPNQKVEKIENDDPVE